MYQISFLIDTSTFVSDTAPVLNGLQCFASFYASVFMVIGAI